MANESQSSNAGGRYAQALFELADQANALSVVEADLVGLKAAIEGSADLRRLLVSPTFTSEQKGKVLLAVADAGKVNPLTRKFLGLLTTPALRTMWEQTVGSGSLPSISSRLAALRERRVAFTEHGYDYVDRGGTAESSTPSPNSDSAVSRSLTSS